MIIKIKNTDCELGFTFNSFKYMGDFDLSALADMESKPFKVIPLIETLLLGAVNNNPKVKFSILDVQRFIEAYIEDGSLQDLLAELMKLLQESRFFKSLQKNNK